MKRNLHQVWPVTKITLFLLKVEDIGENAFSQFSLNISHRLQKGPITLQKLAFKLQARPITVCMGWGYCQCSHLSNQWTVMAHSPWPSYDEKLLNSWDLYRYHQRMTEAENSHVFSLEQLPVAFQHRLDNVPQLYTGTTKTQLGQKDHEPSRDDTEMEDKYKWKTTKGKEMTRMGMAQIWRDVKTFPVISTTGSSKGSCSSHGCKMFTSQLSPVYLKYQIHSGSSFYHSGYL